MVTDIVTVAETDTMEEVSKLFEQQDVNAAPVVDQDHNCVGIITSHDIVEYEAQRQSMATAMGGASGIGLGNFWDKDKFRLSGFLFGEVGFHMSKLQEQVGMDDCLDTVARSMCKRHIHHIVVLDAFQKPIGLLSSLDLLGILIDQPVCRSLRCSG
jgi:CBS domain-containing protein